MEQLKRELQLLPQLSYKVKVLKTNVAFFVEKNVCVYCFSNEYKMVCDRKAEYT